MSAIIGCLSVAFGAWTITSALAHSDWPRSVSSDARVIVALLLTVVYSGSLVCAIGEYYEKTSLLTVNLFTAVILGLSLSWAYCIITPAGWINHYHRLAWIMGGVFTGCAIEVTTGFLAALAQALQI